MPAGGRLLTHAGAEDGPAPVSGRSRRPRDGSVSEAEQRYLSADWAWHTWSHFGTGRARNWRSVHRSGACEVPSDHGRVDRSGARARALVRAWRARMRSRKPGANRSICRSTASVMSTSDPCGTCTYAHPVCWPAGARVESKRLCWATTTNGRAGCSPLQLCISLTAIASYGPPTCDHGPGLATCLRAPWNWAVERPVQLEDARTVAVAFERAPVARWQLASERLRPPGAG